MIGDTELLDLRQLYYSLLVKLFWTEPAPELIETLKKDLADRAAGAGELHPLLGEGWLTIGKALEKMGVEQVADEYTRMFLGPFQPQVSPYESLYLTGMLYKEPLIEVRAFMEKAGLKKIEKKSAEPEDVLAFELEIMNWLVAKQKMATTPEEEAPWVDLQAEFLREHLLVWAPTCAREIRAVENAVFFSGVAQLLEGFLELEKEWFHGLGVENVAPLSDARKKFSKKSAFSGPVFDPETAGKKTKPTGK